MPIAVVSRAGRASVAGGFPPADNGPMDEHPELSVERDPPRPFTDEEAAFLRHVRFGQLPDRVPPAERVELSETDTRQDRPEPAGDPFLSTLRMSPPG
jgi:hypothetical protein